MIEADILKALQERVLSIMFEGSEITLEDSDPLATEDNFGSILVEDAVITLPVKFMGRTFIPPANGTKWLEVFYIPNNIENEFWDTGKTYRGLFRMILHWPMDDAGFYAPLQTAAAIAAIFPKGLELTSGAATIRITDEPNLTNALEQPPDNLFPISVKYLCFKAA